MKETLKQMGHTQAVLRTLLWGITQNVYNFDLRSVRYGHDNIWLWFNEFLDGMTLTVCKFVSVLGSS